jgi:PAS domain S-box-containing protein
MQRTRRKSLPNVPLLRSERGFFRQVVESLPQLTWICAVDGRCDYLSPQWVHYTGKSEAEHLGYGWLEQLHPDDRESVAAQWQAAAATGENFDTEFRLRRYDGAYRWFRTLAVPLRDEAGRIVKWFGSNVDIDDLKQAEMKVRAGEERYRGIFQHAGTGIAVTDLEGWFQSCNPAYAAMLGYTEEELRNRVAADLVYPEDRETNMVDVWRLLAEEIRSFEIVNRYVRKDRAPLWIHKHVSLLRDPTGRPAHTIELITDISERKCHEEHVHLLLREINHRAKNMLSVVDAIAHRIAVKNPEGFVERFSERIQALSANQDLLVRNEWRGVEVDDLIRGQLAHFADLIGSRVVLYGPKLRLQASSVQAIGLALHELATNAGKYGALSTDTGRVDICWGADSDTFTMSWTERDGPPVSPPARLGFGSTVVDSMAKLSVGGEVQFDYAPSGVQWRLTCPRGNALERRT